MCVAPAGKGGTHYFTQRPANTCGCTNRMKLERKKDLMGLDGPEERNMELNVYLVQP